MHPPLQQLARPARRRVAAPGGKANGVSADEAPSIGRRPANKRSPTPSSCRLREVSAGK